MIRGRAGRAALTLAVTALTAHAVCDLVFDCGCAWAFAGGADHCDIQVPGPPDCPVCTRLPVGALLAATLYAGWWTLLALIARAWAPHRRSGPGL